MKYEYLIKRYDLGFFKSEKKHIQAFNDLGSEGWELIEVVPIAEPVAFTAVAVTKLVMAYFKRPL